MAELLDQAGIFVGDTAEALGLMQYAVIRDPGRLDFAPQVMTEAMLHLVDHFTARERKGEPQSQT